MFFQIPELHQSIFLLFFRDCLDTTDPEHLGAKLAVLAIGAVLYAILNILSYRNCVKTFEKVDL